MIELTESTIINAPSRLVWDSLANLDKYHLWNSYLQPLDGHLAVGSHLTLKVRPPFVPPVVVSPRVTERTEGCRIEFGGDEAIHGALMGTLSMEIHPVEMESCEFRATYSLHGMMAPFYVDTLLVTLKNGLMIMKDELKLHTETLYDEALMGRSFETLPHVRLTLPAFSLS